MIIKSLSRKSNSTQLIKYALRYSMKEKHSNKNKEQATVIIRHNIRSRSIENIIKEFKENESFRLYKRKDSVVLFHTILSFSPKDRQRISDIMLKDIGKKFVELRAQDCLCLAVVHKEKEHIHTHFLVSGVKTNSYSSRVSKAEFKTIINELESYQQKKYPELINSKNKHQVDKSKSKEEIINALQTTRQSIKASLLQHLEKGFSQATSYQDFLSKINSHDYSIYQRNNKAQGVIVDGIKFRFSRLGFSEERFEQLTQRENDEQSMLTELKNIRNQKDQVKQRNILEKQSKDELENAQIEDKALQELVALRESSKEIQREEYMEREPIPFEKDILRKSQRPYSRDFEEADM